MYFNSHSHFRLFCLIVDQFLFLIQLFGPQQIRLYHWNHSNTTSIKHNDERLQLQFLSEDIGCSHELNIRVKSLQVRQSLPFLSHSWETNWCCWYFDLLTGDRGQMLVVGCSCSWELPWSLSNTAVSVWPQSSHSLSFIIWGLIPTLSPTSLPAHSTWSARTWHSKLNISKPINNQPPNHHPPIRISSCARTEIMTDDVCTENSIVQWIIHFGWELSKRRKDQLSTRNNISCYPVTGDWRQCNYSQFLGLAFLKFRQHSYSYTQASSTWGSSPVLPSQTIPAQ